MVTPSFRITALRRREPHPNLIGAWNFDEGGGAIAHDSLGLNIPLTVDAGVTWVGGHAGGFALNNAGTGGAHRTWSLSAQTTIMCWARPTNLASNTDRALIGVWATNDSSGSTYFAIWAQRSSYGVANVLQGNVRINGGLADVEGPALTLNTWTHLALTFDGVNIRMYKDGAQVTSINNTGTLDLGTYNFVVAASPSFADIDDVRIFNSALSAAEIAAFMGDPVAAS